MAFAKVTWPVQQGLHIGFLNIRDATNKIDEIATILHNSNNPFHLFGFAESRLTDKTSHDDMHIPGYSKPLRLDPSKPKTTGILVYHSLSLNCTRLTNFENYGVESLWVEIKLKGSKPIIVGFIYRNPAETVDWKDKFNSLMDDIVLLNQEIIVMGDFNIDFFKPYQSWYDNYSIHGLEQLIDIPTRITENTRTLIDHIYSNCKAHITELCAPPCGCSDHNAVCLTWINKKVKIPKVGHKTIYYRCFKNFNTEEFLSDLAKSSFDNIYQIRNPDDAADFWIDTFSSIYNKHAPFIKKRVKHRTKPPWITKEIDAEIETRNYLKQFGSKVQFKRQRNKVNSLKRRSKRQYFQKLLVSTNDSRNIWKAINILSNKNASKNQQSIRDISPEDLNNHFANIAERTIVNDRTNDNTFLHMKEFVRKKPISFPFNLPYMTVLDVIKSISLLKQSGSRDLEGLDGKILAIACPIIVDSLTYLYNLCIEKNYVPLKFKKAKIIPFYKSGDPSDPCNYRPISILSVIAKPFEKHLHKHLYSYVVRNDLLHNDQSGFRKNHSCHTSLIQLTNDLFGNINENKFSGLIFIDFQKAFDVIKPSVLLQKLDILKLNSDFVSLISSFLTDRNQCVAINSQTSKLIPTKYGVPQGSVLGPLLFSIYVNDLPCFLNDKCEMFADDTTLHSCDSDPNVLNKKLQDNIEKVVDWTELNHMALNSQKTKCMYVSARQKRQKMQSCFRPLYIGQNVVEEVNSHKILGVVIDRDLSWYEHTSSLVKRLSVKLFQLSKIKHFLDVHSRKLFFFAHIVPIVDYASTLWDSSSDNNLKLINRMYKRALKLILLKTSLAPHDLKQLNILTLRNRLLFNKAVCMHKVSYGNAPVKISSKFIINQYRHNHLYSLPRPRNNLFKTSFLYSGGNLWNGLPREFKQISNINTFKRKLKAHLIQKQTDELN